MLISGLGPAPLLLLCASFFFSFFFSIFSRHAATLKFLMFIRRHLGDSKVAARHTSPCRLNNHGFYSLASGYLQSANWQIDVWMKDYNI